MNLAIHMGNRDDEAIGFTGRDDSPSTADTFRHSYQGNEKGDNDENIRMVNPGIIWYQSRPLIRFAIPFKAMRKEIKVKIFERLAGYHTGMVKSQE